MSAKCWVTGAPPTITLTSPRLAARMAATTSFMPTHRRRQERRDPDDRRPVLLGRLDELLGRDVRAQVDHLDVGALPHHPDEVLADVVEVALDRPEDRGMLGTDAGLDEDGLEDGGGLLHRPGGDQHLGDVDLVALEPGADDLHRGRHRAEDGPGVHPLVDRLPGDRGRRRPIARLNRRRECRKIRHQSSLPLPVVVFWRPCAVLPWWPAALVPCQYAAMANAIRRGRAATVHREVTRVMVGRGGPSRPTVTSRRRVLQEAPSMQKRDVIKAVLDGKRPPYVPWSIGFTKEASERLRLHYGSDAVETRVQNHFLKLGSDIGFFDDLGNDRVQDVFGVVWNRSIDEDRVLPDANMTVYRFPNPLDPRFFSEIPARIDQFPDRFRVFQIGFSLYERGWTLRGMENLM